MPAFDATNNSAKRASFKPFAVLVLTLAGLISTPALAENSSRQSNVYTKDGVEFTLPAGWAIAKDRALQYVRCIEANVASGPDQFFAATVEIFRPGHEMSLEQYANHTVHEANKRGNLSTFTIAERRPARTGHGFDIQTVVFAARGIETVQFSIKSKTLRKDVSGRSVFFTGLSELGEHTEFDESVLSIAKSFRILP